MQTSFKIHYYGCFDLAIKMITIRPWPNDSIFHSIFSSTFDLKVERLLSVVEHRWPNGSIFRSTFLSTFQQLIFPQRRVNEKYLPSQIFDRLTRRYCACFHSTCSTRWPNGSIFTQQQLFSSIFLTKIKLHSTSLDSTRLTQQGGQTARFFPRFFVE